MICFDDVKSQYSSDDWCADDSLFDANAMRDREKEIENIPVVYGNILSSCEESDIGCPACFIANKEKPLGKLYAIGWFVNRAVLIKIYKKATVSANFAKEMDSVKIISYLNTETAQDVLDKGINATEEL